jgi:hypothetical protein
MLIKIVKMIKKNVLTLSASDYIYPISYLINNYWKGANSVFFIKNHKIHDKPIDGFLYDLFVQGWSHAIHNPSQSSLCDIEDAVSKRKKMLLEQINNMREANNYLDLRDELFNKDIGLIQLKKMLSDCKRELFISSDTTPLSSDFINIIVKNSQTLYLGLKSLKPVNLNICLKNHPSEITIGEQVDSYPYNDWINESIGFSSTFDKNILCQLMPPSVAWSISENSISILNHLVFSIANYGYESRLKYNAENIKSNIKTRMAQ